MDIYRIPLTKELKEKITKRLPEGMVLNGIDKHNSCKFQVDYSHNGVSSLVNVDLIGRMLSIRISDGEWLSVAVEAETSARKVDIQVKDICYLFVGYIGYLADHHKIDVNGKTYRIFSEIHVGNDANFREIFGLFWDKVIVYTYPQTPDQFCVELVSREQDSRAYRYHYRSTDNEVILEHPSLSIKFPSSAFKSKDTTKILRLLKATRAAIQASENPVKPEVEKVEQD